MRISIFLPNNGFLWDNLALTVAMYRHILSRFSRILLPMTLEEQTNISNAEDTAKDISINGSLDQC